MPPLQVAPISIYNLVHNLTKDEISYYVIRSTRHLPGRGAVEDAALSAPSLAPLTPLAPFSDGSIGPVVSGLKGRDWRWNLGGVWGWVTGAPARRERGLSTGVSPLFSLPLDTIYTPISYF